MPPQRFRNTFFTKRQIEVLSLRAQGLTIKEIARKLGISRANAYAILRSAQEVVRRARNTLNVYSQIVSYIVVNVGREISLNEVVDAVLREADLHNVRLQVRSSDILLAVIKDANECVDLDRLKIICELRILISPRGFIKIVKS